MEMIDARGRLVLRKNGVNQPIWGHVQVDGARSGAKGSFTARETIPSGTVVSIQVTTGNGNRSQRDIGVWLFAGILTSMGGFTKYDIEKVH